MNETPKGTSLRRMSKLVLAQGELKHKAKKIKTVY